MKPSRSAHEILSDAESNFKPNEGIDIECNQSEAIFEEIASNLALSSIECEELNKQFIL